MRKFLGWAAMLGWLAWSWQPAGAAEAVAAHVVGMDHPASAYTVLRDNRKLPITFNMPLQNGDVIVVDDPQAAISVRFVDRRDMSISRSQSPYTVHSLATKPEVTSNFLLTLWANVTKAKNAGFRSTSARDVNVSEGFSDFGPKPLALPMPGLAAGTARVSAGDRYIMMRWEGGTAPYRFVLRDAKEDTLVDEAGISTRMLAIRSHTVNLVPGRYVIEISDNGNTVVRGSFTAAGGIFDMTHLTDGDTVEASTNAAALIAAGDDLSLYFEAYLRLGGALAQHWEPAEALAGWIANGAPKD
jgi:hypothetical protein